MPKEALVEFEDYTEEAAAADKKEIEETKSRVILKLSAGRTVLRVVPARPGRKWKRVTHIHAIEVPGAGTAFYVCPRIEAQRPCPSCTAEQRLMATGNATDEERAKGLRARRTCFCNVIVRGEENAGVRVWRFGVQIDEQLIGIREDQMNGGNFIHPTAGFDLSVVRKGSGRFDTEYIVTPANKGKVLPLAGSAAEMQELINTAHDLERYARVLPDAAIAKILRGEKLSRDDFKALGDGGKKPSRSIEDELDELDA